MMTGYGKDRRTAELMQRTATSYRARLSYKPGTVYPPDIPGVAGAIDIHCHAHEGQQDALALAKLASMSGMGGLLFKTIGSITGDYNPVASLRNVQDDLKRWGDDSDIVPVRSWAGYGIAMDGRTPSPMALRAALEQGAAAVWMPVFNHAMSFHRAGGMKKWFDRNAPADEQMPPLPWEEARRRGLYLLDDSDRELKPVYQECLRIVADFDVPIFIGHASWQELVVFVEALAKLNIKRKVIDHPFSPFINLDLRRMRDLAEAGFILNFTYDEISPLLGIDPVRIYEAIRTVGVSNASLSSDVGEPIFPHSVEAIRLLKAHMAACGLSDDELAMVSSKVPAELLGVSLSDQVAPRADSLASS